MVAISIPQLDTLNIKPAAPGGDPSDEPNEYTCRIIAYRIAFYHASPSCRRLPLLSVGLKQFLDDGRLRYLPSPNNPLDSEYDSEYDDLDSELDFDYGPDT